MGKTMGEKETKNDFSNEKHKTFSVECRSTGEYVLERHQRELNSHGNRNGAQTRHKKPCIGLHSCALYMYRVVSRVGVVIRFMLLPSSMHRRNVLFSVFRQNIFGWLRISHNNIRIGHVARGHLIVVSMEIQCLFLNFIRFFDEIRIYRN